MDAPLPKLTEFPASRPTGQPFAVPAEYARLFASDPVPRAELPTGQPVWLVGRHADMRVALTGTVSSNGGNPGFPMARGGPASTSKMLSFFRMDGADHRRYRKLTTASFTLAGVSALRPALAEILKKLIDDMVRQGPPADLVEALALPVPSQVICRILGVPYQDRQHFQRLSNILTRGPGRGAAEFADAIGELHSYIAKLAEAKRAEPGNDLITALIKGFDADASLDSGQLVVIVLLLLVAGHETTAAMISLGVLALMNNQAQREALTGDPELTSNAVEELLRYVSIAQWVPRVAVADFAVAGVRVRAGEGLVILPLMVNHDPVVFPDPGRLDLRRANASRHIAFGFGPHQCVGLQLARAELQLVYSALFKRLPGLRLAVPASQLVLRERAAMLGIESLPVTW